MACSHWHHHAAPDRPQHPRAALVAARTATPWAARFLGLPAVVKPAGFVPTVVTLTASWLFLLAEALVVAEAVGRCRGRPRSPPSRRRPARASSRSEASFFAFVTATLASQLSKAGTLLPVSYRAATLAAAVAACVAALGPSTKRAADLNAVLTAVFAASAVGVGVSAATAVKSGTPRLRRVTASHHEWGGGAPVDSDDPPATRLCRDGADGQ